MSAVLYQFISRHPELDYQLPPPLSPRGVAALRRAAAEIDADPRLFPGPVAMIRSFDSQLPAFTAFPADYRWALAQQQAPEIAAKSAGLLGVNIAIANSRGQYLYHRRSGLVRDSWQWSFGISGKVSPALGFPRAAEECLSLKLGIGAIAGQLQPQAVVIFRQLPGFRVVYRLTIDDQQSLNPNGDYLEDLFWSDSEAPPAELLSSSATIQEVVAQRQRLNE
jgi:hypothetical protein